MNGPNIVKYVNAGIIEPLDSYIEKDNVDLANYPSAMINLYNVNGKQYGIPVDYDTIGVWYNKTLFDAAGVEYPKDGWTWDEFVETAKKLTKADGSVYGVNADPNSQCGYYNTILESGGYIISDDKKTSGYDTDGAAKGIQVWLDLIDQGLSPDLASFAETKADAQFYSGRLAMNEAALLRNDITVEVIADGRHIPKETMLLAYRMKGPEKMALITDAMRAAGTSVTKSILGSKTGGVPVVIKDGVAQLPDFSSYAGSIATMHPTN